MNLVREKDGLESSLKAGSGGNRTFVEVVLENQKCRAKDMDFSWPKKLLGLQAADTQSCSNFCPKLEGQEVVVQPLFVSHGAKEMVRSDDSIKQVSDGNEEV
ncbi:hypothetical protein LWI28_018479 [Acer negundo]|uniref:Uncharacterized protein n=1 Tax=Acer negundo TaxID=4023 RepID=A0AAD5J6Q7_ACENE|nr:hypothetical protein LWI28_018479 [Acer negundo]